MAHSKCYILNSHGKHTFNKDCLEGKVDIKMIDWTDHVACKHKSDLDKTIIYSVN